MLLVMAMEHHQVDNARRKELEALAVRKYMDAFCVYFWATTSLLFTLLTFGLFTLLGHDLTPSAVFTSLALFNVLIAPLNSFPWVINGTVEGVVSVRRLQTFLMAPETKASWLHGGESYFLGAAHHTITTLSAVV